MHVFPYISEVYTLSVWNITFPLKRGLTAYRVAVRSKGILGKYKTGYWVLHDPSIEYFKCNRKDLGGFRASELFPELSLLLLFLSLDDSQRSFGVWGWELLACWALPVTLSGLFVLGEPWEEDSLLVTAPGKFIYLSVTDDSWRANGGGNPGLSKWQLPKHFLGENDPRLRHCGVGVVMISSDLSLSPLTPLP